MARSVIIETPQGIAKLYTVGVDSVTKVEINVGNMPKVVDTAN